MLVGQRRDDLPSKTLRPEACAWTTITETIMPNENCVVCEGPLEAPTQISDSGNRKSIECPRCGNFTIADEGLLTEHLQRMAEDDRKKLSAWIRTEYRIDFVVTPENFEDICQDVARRDYKVSEKQLLLLRHLERLTKYPGNHVELDLDVDYPVIWAYSIEELMFHLDELARRGLIEKHGPMGPLTVSNDFRRRGTVSIATSGWKFLDDNSTSTNVSEQAFVAMSFSKPMKSVFSEGIRPALKKAGYRAYRVDFDEHIQRIDAKIEHEIRNSAFVVADVTEQKQGVYYEAGFAIGLGLPVIWSVNEREKEDVHFDTRQYNHIVWTDEAQLKEKLFHRVSAVIGIRRQAR